MRKIFNYNTGKLYESDSNYEVTILERPLSDDVVVDPNNNEWEFNQTFLSYDEALAKIDNAVDELCASEGLERNELFSHETKNGFIYYIPGYKEWEFVITGDVEESCEHDENKSKVFEDGESDDVNFYYENMVITSDIILEWYDTLRREYPEMRFTYDEYCIILKAILDNDVDSLGEYWVSILKGKLGIQIFKSLFGIKEEISSRCGLTKENAEEILRIILSRRIDNSHEYNESVSTKFSRLRSLFEEAGLDEEDDEENKKDDEEKDTDDNEDGDDKDDEKKDDENGDDDSQEMKAVVITVKKGDEDKCKDELIEAGVDEDDIDILEGEEDDDNVDIRIDVNSVMELKDYLDKKGIDLEEEIGGEIVSDDDDESSDEEGDEDKSDDGSSDDEEGDFDFNDLGDIFGADEEEEK